MQTNARLKAKLLPLLATLCSASALAGVLTLPQLSGHRINMYGDNSGSPREGLGAFSRIAEGQADSGHYTISLHAPAGTRAYYYVAGLEHTPDPTSPTDTAFGTSLTGMADTTAYFNAHGGSALLLSLRCGQSGADRTKTWNLGGDQQNLNWWGSADSTIEERKYEAIPANIESALYYNGTRLLNFGYTPFYMIIDYGPTTANNDDVISAYSDAVSATKLPGLPGYEDGLANAILGDMAANGGLAQLYFQTIQSATREDFFDAQFAYGAFAFSGSIQIVPEPAQFAPVAGLLALALVRVLRRRS